MQWTFKERGKKCLCLSWLPWCQEIPKFKNSFQGNSRKNQAGLLADLLRDIIQGFLSCRITISLWWWLLLIKFAFLWTLQSCTCMNLFNSYLLRQHIRITKLCKLTLGNSYSYKHIGKNTVPSFIQSHSWLFEGSSKINLLSLWVMTTE